MPCTDITDTLKIQLDFDNRIVRYSLRKKTCQGEVGRKALILKWLKKRELSEITEMSPEIMLTAFPTKSKTWEYLYLKHFLAVQSGLKVLMGKDKGGVNDYCKVYSSRF